MNKKMIKILRVHHDGKQHKRPDIYGNITDIPVDIEYNECADFNDLLFKVNSYVNPKFSGVTQITQLCEEKLYTQYDVINTVTVSEREREIEKIARSIAEFIYSLKYNIRK